MANLRSIIRNNNSTFYNYRSGERIRIWPRIVIFVAISPILSSALTDNLTVFINSINTVVSILLGFGFSVLFYIASTRSEGFSSDTSLENKNRVDRINKLSKELFHNVSYFVLIASGALAFAVIVIAPEAQNDWFDKQILPHLLEIAPRTSDFIGWCQLAIRSVFFFLIIEGGYTFGRIVGRVNFLFEEKLKNTEPEQ